MLDASDTGARDVFSIVGIGSSAGGLDAFAQLLRGLPQDTGLGFVLIQHLDRTHPSLLSEALQRSTAMPVHQAQHAMRVLPNHVYVIAPNTDLSIANGQLVLSPRPPEGDGAFPIDSFLQSLATDAGERAIGVVLSGSGTDGTEGLRAIKAQDGITLAQTPTSARFSGMPQSAISTGLVDYCLDIPELADELVRLSRHPYVRLIEPEGHASDDAMRAEIFARVRGAFAVDFSEFKQATISRRLGRRLALRGTPDLTSYVAVLDSDPEEVRALYEDLLIHATSFFRDPEVFQALRNDVIPAIFRQKSAGAPVRVWVAGCSTGEEVYSLAITVLECAASFTEAHPIQIFGTDVSETAIRRARAGIFPESALRDVSEEHRDRYFSKVDDDYRIEKSLRDRCIFVRHDLVSDPPFSKLDLVCCRNVLIYFDRGLQQKVVPLMHYALNQPGWLVLGRSEDIAGFSDLFSVVDKANKIFVRTGISSGLRFTPRAGVDARPAPTRDERISLPTPQPRFSTHLDHLLIARYAPPAVLINEDMEVLLFRGSTGAYLQAAQGQPQHNLINMARGGLVAALRTAIAQARNDKVLARVAGAQIDRDGAIHTCDVVVIPFLGIPNNDRTLFIVLFETPSKPPLQLEDGEALSQEPSATGETSVLRIAQLEHELAATKQYLHALVEDHNRANIELGATNDELLSSNEELQSMNEELETAKEELQSTNQELITLNDELRFRNQEVEQLATAAQVARAEAERSNSAKDDFLATLSHELRTPLSIMLLQSQQLRSGVLKDQAGLRHTGEVLERATWTQVKLIDDLLDVSRIVAGKLTLELRRVDIGAVVRMALDGVNALLEAKSLALTLSIDPELGAIWADALRAQQIVSNLLTNAIKFTPAGGRITVVVDAIEGAARLRVTDTGIGIPASFLPHLFAKFSQGDTSITRKYGGLGLGLALVQHLAELHGGTVSAHSGGSGQGASVVVVFPLASVNADQRLAAASGHKVAPDGADRTTRYAALAELRVLVVDDDVGTREAVSEVLRYARAIVEVAASAADGLTAIDDFKPDVLVCDIAMPDEDGYTFIRKLRARELARGRLGTSLPALALTALVSEEDRKRAFAAGFQLHVSKPIDIDRLRDAVLELSKLVTPPHGDRDVP